jgi:hypothetical protein
MNTDKVKSENGKWKRERGAGLSLRLVLWIPYRFENARFPAI